MNRLDRKSKIFFENQDICEHLRNNKRKSVSIAIAYAVVVTFEYSEFFDFRSTPVKGQ